ncbi:MAG: hypothetical protein SFV21_06820 [Rhodospirillaceae bacterium]|nr:hypothetical protein [Rhodospirillaceae bacterium]
MSPKKTHRPAVGHLPTRRRLLVHAVSAATFITGVVWLIFHYFVRVEDDMGFDGPHPQQRLWLIAHAAVSFAAIWVFGILWPNHVKKSWRAHVRRFSGGVLFGVAMWLTLTGFALYYTGDPALDQAVALMHWIVGVAALAAYLVHLLTQRSTPTPK